MDWIDGTAVTPLGDNRFGAFVGEEWSSLQGVHGGVVAAIAANAVASVLRDEGVDADARLRAATFGYVSGNTVGDLAIEVEVIRRGRAMTTTHARVSQDGKTTTVGRFHHSTPWEGLDYSDVPPPLAKHDDAVRLEFPPPGAPQQRRDVPPPRHGPVRRGGPRRMGGVEPPDRRRHVRRRLAHHVRRLLPACGVHPHHHPGSGCDHRVLDPDPQRAGTWTLADGEYLAARMHTFHSHDGFAVEDGWIHLPDGTLLATVRQTRLAG